LGFERNRAASGERGEDRGSVLCQEGVHDVGGRQFRHVKREANSADFLVESHGNRLAVPALHEVVCRHVGSNGRVLFQGSRFNQSGGHASRDFGAGGSDHVRVVRVLPHDQFFDEVEQVGPLDSRAVLVDAAIGLMKRGVAVGIIHE